MHNPTEVATYAQEKSSEATTLAQMTEERLTAENKSTSFWRQQAHQATNEEAGSLEIPSAAAEVKQVVMMMEELVIEQQKVEWMFASMRLKKNLMEKKQGWE